MKLQNKTAFISGGASGIGRGVALRLAQDGAAVAVVDRNLAGAQSVAAEIIAAGGRAEAIEVDVTNAASVQAAAARATLKLGAPQILVCSAGICTLVPFAMMSEAIFDEMISVHLKGVFHCAKAVADGMIAARWGRIINITSVAGMNGGGSGLLHYASAKGGIIGFTKALAHELAADGITVNAVAPGLIDTPMLRASGMPDSVVEQLAQKMPVKRVGRPEDIAAACAYLASEEAGFVTGQVISPNGGAYL